MQGSHTPASARHHDDDGARLRLVSTADRGLPAELAGAIDGHLATFAEHVKEGLLAASTAVGLEVMAEMLEAEVPTWPASRAVTTPVVPTPGTGPSMARSPSADGGCR